MSFIFYPFNSKTIWSSWHWRGHGAQKPDKTIKISWKLEESIIDKPFDHPEIGETTVHKNPDKTIKISCKLY